MMNDKFVVLAGAVVAIVGAWGGCAVPENGSIEAADSAGAGLPEFLVGTWQPDNSRWVITLADDGTIPRMRHFIGVEFIVAEGGVVEPWRGGAEAMYVLGPCEVDYDGQTRQLSMTIDIEQYIVTFPDGTMEGSFHDTLTGPVSEDGKTWQAKWGSSGTLDGTPGQDHGKVREQQLTFTKVSDDVYEQ